LILGALGVMLRPLSILFMRFSKYEKKYNPTVIGTLSILFMRFRSSSRQCSF